MKKALVIFAVVVPLAGCGEEDADTSSTKSDEPSEKAKPDRAGKAEEADKADKADKADEADEGGKADKAAPTAPDGAGSSGAKLDCDRLLPKELREKYLPGLKMKAEPGPRSLTCMATGREVAIIGYVCVDWDEATFKATMEAGKKAMKGPKDLPDIGKMAYASTGGAMEMLQFWDDDTNCYGTISGTVKDQADLARAVVKALTPAAID